MKRVLVTGAGSYVGGKVLERLAREPEAFQADELDVRGDGWRSFGFSGYDCVLHVAGIAHVSADPAMGPLYMKVNRDLAVEVGRRAKESGVRQLVFMSSAIVYGGSKPHDVFEPIGLDTPIAPEDFYGESKAQAEEGLRGLEDEGFKVAVLRCPMIYGPGCERGNFPKLVRLARMLPAFPDVRNRRSMLYVGNLAELVAQLASRGGGGLYLPQNAEYAETSQMVRMIAEASGRKVRLARALNPAVSVMAGHPLARKAFGNLYYDQAASDFGFGYRPYSLEGSIREIACEDGWGR